MGPEEGRTGDLAETTVPAAAEGLDATAAALTAVPLALAATTGVGTSSEGSALSRGSLIGRYIVLDHLGEGAMGVVFAAIDPELDRKVAIKLLQAGPLARDADARARLVREAQALARLSHPNVVGIFDVGTHRDQVWIAMELVVGRTLSAWLAERRPEWREVLEVMQAAGRGLAAAHAAGLVHRDVKPDNIMLGDDGRVRVMDFGLARRGSEELDARPAASALGVATMLTSEVTHAGAMVGTPAYMAPEQFRGDPVGAPADVFAFSVMLWEGLHGERPFAGATLEELRANVEAGRRTIRRRRDASPRWLDPLLERGFAATAGARWPNMDALLAAIARARVRARRRLGVLFVGLLVCLAGAIVLALALAERRTLAACEADGAAIREDWTDEARAEIERAFAATGKPNAAVVFERTIPWLDRWATSWQAARAGVCAAHRLEETLTDDLRERAEDCLAEHRGTFVALLAQLAHADANTLNRATVAAADLAAVDACTDPLALRERPLPSLERRAAVLAIREDLSRVSSMRGAGQFKEALALARTTASAAEAAEWPAMTSEALYWVSTLESTLGEGSAAEGTAIRSLGEARAAHSAQAAAAALVLLAEIDERGAGRVWAEAAQTELMHVTGDTRLLQSTLDNTLANLRRAEGRYDESRRLSERSIATKIEVLGENHPRVAKALSSLGNAIDRQGAYEEALRIHKRALAIDERTLGPDHPDVATDLNNLAVTFGHLGHRDEALRAFSRALEIRERLFDPSHPKIISSLNNVATEHFSLGRYDEALQLFERALTALNAAPPGNTELKATLVNNCSVIYNTTCRYAEAVRDGTLALKLFEEANGVTHPNVANGLDALTTARLRMGQLDAALATAERSLAVREAALGADHPLLVESLNLLGMVERAGGRTTAALQHGERAVAVAEAKNNAELAWSLGELAETLLAAGRPAEAVDRGERALATVEGASSRGPKIRFTLARALSAVGADPRARVLAQQAAAAALCDPSPTVINAWLAAHPE